MDVLAGAAAAAGAAAGRAVATPSEGLVRSAPGSGADCDEGAACGVGCAFDAEGAGGTCSAGAAGMR